jgi:hypothetical protein
LEFSEGFDGARPALILEKAVIPSTTAAESAGIHRYDWDGAAFVVGHL